MGGSCCKTSGDIEIQFKQTNTFTNKIRKNNNNIRINIKSGIGLPIIMDINQNMTFNEIKKEYCKLIGKKDNNKLIFVSKGKLLDENTNLNFLKNEEEIIIYAFDGNDYNT